MLGKTASKFYTKHSIRTSQKTHHVSATKPNQLMLFEGTVTVHCENHTEHTDTLCGQNAESFNVLELVVHIVSIIRPMV
jgi:hypothetical protein